MRQLESVSIERIEELSDRFNRTALASPTHNVTLMVNDPNAKDIERSLNGLASVSLSSTDSDKVREAKMMGNAVTKGRDDHQLPRVKLWASVCPAHMDVVHHVTFEDESTRAKGLQLEVLKNAEVNGNPATLLVLAGPPVRVRARWALKLSHRTERR